MRHHAVSKNGVAFGRPFLLVLRRTLLAIYADLIGASMTDDDNIKPDLDAAYDLKGPEDNKRLYKAWADSYDADFVDASGYRLARVVARTFVQAGGKGPVLDVGCGTGQVVRNLPLGMVVDGLDLSAEMLEHARRMGRYRNLIEADVTQPLPLRPHNYEGWVSAGTFTHGHVGPQAVARLVSMLRPGGLAVFSGNANYFQTAGFAEMLDGLDAAGQIRDLHISQEQIYAHPAAAPPGHEQDMGKVIVFRAT